MGVPKDSADSVEYRRKLQIQEAAARGIASKANGKLLGESDPRIKLAQGFKVVLALFDFESQTFRRSGVLRRFPVLKLRTILVQEVAAHW
jgi:hypothetical protein